MELVHLFKFSLYGLTAYASWMLGRAEGGWIPYVTFPVLACAYALIETKGGRSLSAGPANLFGAIAVAAAAWEFVQEGQESKLLSGAHLLVYATWIVMFQEKNYRLYWWVMALGVLQVAVGSVLQPGPWYGAALFFYICGALATMSFASLFQVQQQFSGTSKEWSWGYPSTLAQRAAVLVRPSVQHDESQRWLTGRFFGGLGALISLSLVVSAAFFALTPRVSIGPQNLFGSEGSDGPSRRNSTTGFAKDVRLGELGEILESVTPVFTVRFRDIRSAQEITAERAAERLGMDEIQFRGAVMTEYTEGRWYPEQNDDTVRMKTFHNGSGVVEEITLAPTTSEVLFAAGVPEAVHLPGRSEDSFVNLSTGILVHEFRPEANQRFGYSVYVGSVSPKLAAWGALPMPVGIAMQNINQDYLRRTQYFDPSEFPRLASLAQRLFAELTTQLGRKPTASEVGHHFEAHFRDSGEYGYTLNLSVFDPNIDPIEDFLINRKVGHCEYFGTALTLMMRAVGIPARLVSGFKGVEPTALGGSYEVQERFAHVWVEAWSEHDLWITLDPTPSGERSASVAEVADRLGVWGWMKASSWSAWQNYVLNYNMRQQQEGIYGPIRDFFTKLYAVVTEGVASRKTILARLWEILTHPAEWLSVTGGIVTFVCLLLLAGVLRGLWKLIDWLRRGGWGALRGRARQTAIAVAFYERFLKLAAKAGLRPQAAETPYEFAGQVGPKLSRLPGLHELDALPKRVCAAFYRVRYGGETLSAEELATIDTQLRELEQHLAGPTAR
jgi:transglutaminase-like putative cysteine protease